MILMISNPRGNEIGSCTELTGHPYRCGCLECRAWRDFLPMYRSYREAKTLRLWPLYLRAFVNEEPGAKEDFYREFPLNRHERRKLEAKVRKVNAKRKPGYQAKSRIISDELESGGTS